MIGVDTNVLARFYCEDPNDSEAVKQRPIARRIMLDSGPIYVPLTVVLEFEWVMRGLYDADPDEFCAVMDHLLGVPHVTVERWDSVKDACELHRQGLDFADALHCISSAGCSRLVSFDDRRFARRVRRLGLKPSVEVPTA